MGKPGLAACGDQALSRGLRVARLGGLQQHRARVPARADVIVALGGGITADGEPRPATVARARRAAALYRSGRAQRIVMSGAYGMYDPPPPRAEATAMAQIAVAAGVPAEQHHCRDPVAGHDRQRLVHQADAGRTRVASRHRGDLRLACAARAYLTQTIWGPGYRVAIEPVTGERSTRPREEIAVWEAGLLAVSRRWFADGPAG